VAYGF